MTESELTEKIIGAAIEVHKYWGPGLNERLYEQSFCRELDLLGLAWKNQLSLPLECKGIKVGDELILDVIVEDKVIVENKHVNALLPVHESQLLTYMKLTNCKVGLLMNYKVALMKDGIKRMVL